MIMIQGHIRGKHGLNGWQNFQTPVDVKTNLKSYFYNSVRRESRLNIFKRIQHRCLKKLFTIPLFDKPPQDILSIGDAGWL